jgi:hypothetical protein
MNIAKNISKAGHTMLVGTLCSFGVPASLQAAQQDDQQQALREMNVMRNIFDAALEAEGQRNRRMGPPEALYLAGQGMMFTFHLNGMSGFHFTDSMRQQTEQLAAQMAQQTAQLQQQAAQQEQQTAQLRQQTAQLQQQAAQVAQQAQAAAPAVYVDRDFDFDFDYDFDYDFDFAFDGGFDNEEQAALRDQLNDLNEVLRDKQDELRDMQSELRALAREERNDPDTDNQAEMDRISGEMERLQQELQTQAASMQQVQQQYQDARNAVVEEWRTAQSDLIFDTLCSYGNTLRSLENGQHVSIVLRDYTDDQSQVHVLAYADLADCTSAATLRQAGISYLQPEG